MGEGGEALLAQAGQQPAEVAQREAQQRGGLWGPEHPVLHPGQDLDTVLLFAGQGNRLPSHAPRVTDSLSR